MVWKPSKVVLFASVTGTAVGVAYLVKDYLGGKRFEEKVTLDGKVVIITGANTGIGKETALDLAKRNAKVIMACRDMHKCETTRTEIVLQSKNKYVYCRKCDLASQASIREFVDRFKREQSKLHILINNAGVMRCPKSLTEDGIEMQLGVNHIGHFLLTSLLLDTLKASAPSRIINIASIAHVRGKINVSDLNSEKNYDPDKAYSQSKLANILFTLELAKKLEGTGVTVNAVHPGIVDTALYRHMGYYDSTFSAIFLKPFIWPFIKNARQGAQTPIYAAVDPGLQDVTGKYFSNFKEVDVADHAKNNSLAKWLWMTSEKWTNVNVS